MEIELLHHRGARLGRTRWRSSALIQELGWKENPCWWRQKARRKPVKRNSKDLPGFFPGRGLVKVFSAASISPRMAIKNWDMIRNALEDRRARKGALISLGLGEDMEAALILGVLVSFPRATPRSQRLSILSLGRMAVDPEPAPANTVYMSKLPQSSSSWLVHIDAQEGGMFLPVGVTPPSKREDE